MTATPLSTAASLGAPSSPAVSSPAKVGTPSPAELDQLIADYQHQQQIADESQTIANTLQGRIIEIVRAHGSIPEGAQQSWRLQGHHSTATVTVGTTKTLRDEHIGNLLHYMHEHGLLDLFNRMFRQSTRFTLLDGARDVLVGVKLAERTREKILSLFGMCLEVKDRKPTLKVEAVKPEKPARKPRGGKVAA